MRGQHPEVVATANSVPFASASADDRSTTAGASRTAVIAKLHHRRATRAARREATQYLGHGPPQDVGVVESRGQQPECCVERQGQRDEQEAGNRLGAH